MIAIKDKELHIDDSKKCDIPADLECDRHKKDTVIIFRFAFMVNVSLMFNVTVNFQASLISSKMSSITWILPSAAVSALTFDGS